MIHGHPTLVFEPSEELVFRDKLGHVTGVQLIIKNKNLEEIYFKVKSTASKFYSVRPSSGTIKPHGQVKVVIQPHDDSVKALDVIEENNHRFMIQSSFVDTKAPKTAEDFWQNLDKSKIPVTTAKLHVRVKRLEPSSSNEAINGSKFEHKQGLVDQHEAFALAHFHVQNGAKENAKATNSGKNVKYDHVNKSKDDALNNITPVIPLVRNASINETIGLEEPAKEKQNVKNVQTNVTQTKEFVAIGKEVQVDNKEVNNSPKNESKLKESPTKPIINNEVMVETEEIEKLTTLNLGSSNAGECKEEMRAQLLTSPLPNNQPTQLTFANTSMIDGKIDNFSTSMVKPQQQPLFNPSQFCYYPMHFMDSAFHGGVENGNGYYGRYIASVLDKMPKKMTISLKRDIAELIAKYEQQVAESEEDYVLKH